MNRTARVLMGLVAFGFLLAPVATAQTNQGQLKPDNEGIFTHITMDCFHFKLKLSKVHERDGVMRVSLGQAYDSLSSKLITKLNTKIASQNLDGGKLLAHAAAFQKEHAAFIDSYKTYEFAMNHLLKSDCRTQSQQFYLELKTVQSMRQEVHQRVGKLQRIANDYYVAFEAFEASLPGQLKEQHE